MEVNPDAATPAAQGSELILSLRLFPAGRAHVDWLFDSLAVAPRVPGFLSASMEVEGLERRMGGRDLAELRHWTERLEARMGNRAASPNEVSTPLLVLPGEGRMSASLLRAAVHPPLPSSSSLYLAPAASIFTGPEVALIPAWRSEESLLLHPISTQTANQLPLPRQQNRDLQGRYFQRYCCGYWRAFFRATPPPSPAGSK